MAFNESGNAQIHVLRDRPSRIDKPARIVIDKTSSMDCLVRNLSATGALVMVSHPTYLPDRIVVAIPDMGFERAARIKWRRARSIGLIFN